MAVFFTRLTFATDAADAPKRGGGGFGGRGVPCWSAFEEAAHTGRPHAGRASWWTLPFGLAGARGTRCSTLFTPFKGRLAGVTLVTNYIRGVAWRAHVTRTRERKALGSQRTHTLSVSLPSSWLAGEPNLHQTCRQDHRRPRCRWRMRDLHLRPTPAGARSRRLAARVPPVLLAPGAFSPSLEFAVSLSLSFALLILYPSSARYSRPPLINPYSCSLALRQLLLRAESGRWDESRLMTSPRDAYTVNREWHWATKERECSFIGAFLPLRLDGTFRRKLPGSLRLRGGCEE